ncbi:nicotinate-nucleotide adenylyltransferase [Parvibaculum sp.]|uniref:nicotinate-nucleotide adenylyltransferase n=1 Tax=Parvibaculum sp. TaxID=2024848 RepID=UPI003C765A91
MPEETLTPGLKVGLLGGSFNPAHEGHRHISLMCLEAMELDCVWWMVSPGNPLKPQESMASFDERLNSAREMARDPRIIVSDIETRLGTRYTADTLAALTRRHPEVHFVWLMGADNMLQFPQWRNWRTIAETVPIAVYPRPGYTEKALTSPAAQELAHAILRPDEAKRLPLATPPALIFLSGPETPLSATEIREKSGWGREATKGDAG